jgi:hypothetical protein
VFRSDRTLGVASSGMKGAYTVLSSHENGPIVS